MLPVDLLKKHFVPILFFTVISQNVFAQVNINGRIIGEDNRPIPYASVKLLNRNTGTVTDTLGNFSIAVPRIRQNDSLQISTISHEMLLAPVVKGQRRIDYILKSQSKKLENVTVRFRKEDIAGAKTENVGFFRSWLTENVGGEIGRSINVPHKEYQVSKVRFKIYSSCDTNIIRLHIREFKDGRPGKELLDKTVYQTIYKAAIADKAYEFDLNSSNIVGSPYFSAV